MNEFIIGLQLVLNSFLNPFIFNDTIYKQTFSTSMGSPLSPIIADIVLQDLESKALSILPFYVPFYIRYVDDIAMTAPPSFFQKVLEVFNSFHSRLQFTMEVGLNKRLNFLHVTIITREERFIFDWFHKPTFSSRYLNFFS